MFEQQLIGAVPSLEVTFLVVGVALEGGEHDTECITSLPPGHFIPVAEEMGLIIPLGAALLRAACSDAVRWRDGRTNRELQVNVNVSERQFRENDFVPMVQQTLRETGLPPEALTLELTESILLSDFESGIARLHELEELGVRLSLDDFGMGYCSLAYLSRLPVKALKVDCCFPSPLAPGLEDGSTERGDHSDDSGAGTDVGDDEPEFQQALQSG